MDYSVAGLIGAAVAVVGGLVGYVVMLPSLQQRLRAIAPRETAEQRDDIELKLGVMRRLILTIGLPAFGWGGYWLGARLLGSFLGG
jgi:hypothetical protein